MHGSAWVWPVSKKNKALSMLEVAGRWSGVEQKKLTMYTVN